MPTYILFVVVNLRNILMTQLSHNNIQIPQISFEGWVINTEYAAVLHDIAIGWLFESIYFHSADVCYCRCLDIC